MNKPASKAPVPHFKTEADERAYWETHDSTDHLDWSKAEKVRLPKLRPTTKTISLRLPQHLLERREQVWYTTLKDWYLKLKQKKTTQIDWGIFYINLNIWGKIINYWVKLNTLKNLQTTHLK